DLSARPGLREPERMNHFTDVVACGPYSSLMVTVRARPIIRSCRQAGEAARNLYLVASRSDNEGALPAQAAHEQAQFKQNVIAGPQSSNLTTREQVLRRRHEYCNIKSREFFAKAVAERATDIKQSILQQ